MKILQVRFKNLNSLAGEWTIDLTHPAFASDGIFAITGPTGAGKTTILDALCLALYGRTPRLNRVTKGGNEIMSRQTGECFAEVTFETQAGRFRCHWSQRRARKKPDGELQAPKHEIANAHTGEIFESKMRGVADQIESVTGMDFDRFTRSMLLAQGGFAAFLQAAPDERAPILEQITGTEIYSAISIRVHERRSLERKRLDSLQAELDGMQPLTPEEEQQLAESLDRKGRQDTELTQQLAGKSHAILWLEGMARLENELKALDRAKTELLTRMEAFAPERQRLQRAHQALELAADHAALTAIRTEQNADQSSLAECRAALPGCAATSNQAEAAMKTALEQLAARKAEQRAALPIIRKVRELDLKITERDAPIKAARDAMAELSSSLDELDKQRKRDWEDLAGQRKALGELQELLTVSQGDEKLVEQLAGLRSRFEELRTIAGQLAGKRKETTRAERGLFETLNTWREQTARLNAEREQMEKTGRALTEQRNQLLRILDGKEMAEWRKQQAAWTARKELIATTAAAVQSLATSGRAGTQLENRQTTLLQEEAALAGALAAQTGTQAALEKEVDLLETQLTLLKRIEDLRDARQQLQDGDPCPLCGAKEHPFAAGNIPIPGETQQRLAIVRGELKQATGALSDLNVTLAKVNKDLEQTAAALKEQVGNSAEASRVIGDNLDRLDFGPKLETNAPELPEKLDQLQIENSRLLTRATDILETADAMEKKLAVLRDSLEKARDSVANRERQVQAAVHGKDVASQLLDRLGGETAEYGERLKMSVDSLGMKLAPYGLPPVTVESIDATHEQLAARRDQWVSRNNRKTALERKITALEIQTRHQAEQLSRGEEDLGKQRAALTGLQGDQETLRSERQELFGEQKTGAEEKRLVEAIESADKILDGARRNAVAASQTLGQLKSRTDELEKALNAREHQLELQETSFRGRLQASGFANEEQYLASRLPESERADLTRRAQKLADENTEIVSREREKTGLLEQERRKNLTGESLEDLSNTRTALAEAQRDLQREIGGIRQKLRDNDLVKQRSRERLQAMDAQKRECLRWDRLHELIGSADGKKYRNFAQGLTFEMMVGHANRQLQKMTDRYLLIRDDAQPLELNVVDGYQAGEIRSTKNLSGGECFIVSLALALGLSHMASKNVRVDSLFLDEGFGTLDEEALDTALETLANLRRDGKLIGIISHVPALKERIGVRIQVTPRTGGRSRISGPGCSGSPVP